MDEIALYKTIPALVQAWQQTKADIETAYGLLNKAEGRLKDIFEDSSRLDVGRDTHGNRIHYGEPEKKIAQLKKEVWRNLIERLEIKRVLSVKKAKILDDCIEKGTMEDGQPFPDITEENILNMLKSYAANIGEFKEQAVKEVFEFLRPHNSDYKTNSEFEIGKRVILGWFIEKGYGAAKFHVNYNRYAEIRALDNVFHLLDGKGITGTHYGPLFDAINASPDGRGETDYFRFKCYSNNNFHLEFKRPDLVKQLNAIAGGMNLRQAAQAA